MEKADAPLMRCFRMTLPCVSITHTATGTAARDAAVSTRSAIVFARVSKSMTHLHDEDRARTALDSTDVRTQMILNRSRLVKAELHECFEPRLCCRPRDGGHAGVPSSRHFHVGWQAGVHETLGLRDRPLVERGDAGRQRVDKAVEFGVRQRPVHIAV